MKLIKQCFAIGTSLVAGSVLALSGNPAQAYSFDNTGISFDTDTTVDFSFVSSNGLFRSDLGVFQVSGTSATFLGTLLLSEDAPGYIATTPDYPGTASLSNSSYTFAAGTTYTLGLISEEFTGSGYIPRGTLFSTDSLNIGSTPMNNALFAGDVFSGTTVIFDDDGANNDNDLNDFVFTARATPVASVPEPTTIAGLGLVAGALAVSRRRKISKSL
jgi:hypothetical protein